MRLRQVGRFTLLGLIASSAPSGADDSWKKTLENELKAKYAITERRMGDRIGAVGTILVVRKEGIRGDAATKTSVTPTEVVDGTITKGGGGDVLFGSSNARAFKVGDRVYVHDIKVKDDSVDFIIGTVETFEGVVSRRNLLGNRPIKAQATNTRYLAAVRVRVGAPRLSAAAIAQAIRPILATDAEASPETKTVAAGQSMTQVREALGAPTKILELSTRTVWVYADIKVTFVGGKVTDIQ